jgi:D-glycero-D-manno-heptose 1,7-bisphosphate phosphatase
MDCDCRKPIPGMIFRAARELHLSLPDSVLVGDNPSNIQAARASGVGKAYIVHSDNGESGPGLVGADAAYADLHSCVAKFCGTSLKPQNN